MYISISAIRYIYIYINILSVLDMKYWNRCCQSKARPFVVLGVAVLCCMLVRWIVSSGCKYRICGFRGWGFEANTPSKFKLNKFTQIYYLKQGPWTSSGIQNYPPPPPGKIVWFRTYINHVFSCKVV